MSPLAPHWFGQISVVAMHLGARLGSRLSDASRPEQGIPTCLLLHFHSHAPSLLIKELNGLRAQRLKLELQLLSFQLFRSLNQLFGFLHIFLPQRCCQNFPHLRRLPSAVELHVGSVAALAH